MNRLTNRSALITGGTGGVGRAIAEAVAEEGATVVISGRDAPRGLDVVERIRSHGGRAEFVKADLSSTEQIRALADEARTAAGGRIDILVNNAAYALPAHSLTGVTEEQIDRMLAINIKAPFLLTAALMPDLARRHTGTVINVGSIAGAVGLAEFGLYGASKAGLHSLTKSWAAEFGPLGVRVNAVVLGPTRTELNTDLEPLLQSLTASYPARRPGTAAEVAAVVVFLAGDESSHVHGVLLPVDGGGLTR
ncbi:MAG TPA: SDR family oxidoreductase [Pseudonocardiaceae bacterium]|nr:SDR family oxidoreductase [Pseudonocardiaceae bacterium]